MKYSEFLEECRKRSGIKTKSAFGIALGGKTGKYYINLSNDVQRPSTELLETAAKLAGIDFFDCLQIPGQAADPDDEYVKVFKAALKDSWRRDMAIHAHWDLKNMPKPRKPRYGGRQRRQK